MTQSLQRLKVLIVIAVVGTISYAILEVFFPAGLDTKSTKQARALLFDDPSFQELPDKAEISIDGIKAEFQKGDKSYDQLIDLLHNGRSLELLEKNGGPIAYSGTRCGELVIRNYGIASRFRIVHGKNNLYWIWLPHLQRPGSGGPLFTADPRVVDLVKATGTK